MLLVKATELPQMKSVLHEAKQNQAQNCIDNIL